MKISGTLVDPNLRAIYGAEVTVVGGQIESIVRKDNVPDVLIMPGFIDSHVHIESSMSTPGAFAIEAVKHGTVAVVADPHEISNVLGADGLRFMIDDAESVPLRFVFGVPSCVPATDFESSGAKLDSSIVKGLLMDDRTGFLAEVMNYPGVINGDAEIMKKIAAAREAGKPVDGHAPGLSGDELRRYVAAGISTDHECSNLEEAREKLSHGMKILIREGSAAKNLEQLCFLISDHQENVMLCCDDIHPDDLVDGHINKIFKRLLDMGYSLFDLLTITSVNPAKHYNTGTGLLREGDNADFIIIDNLDDFNVLATWIGGREVYGGGEVRFSYSQPSPVNKFNCSPVPGRDIESDIGGREIRLIEVYDGQLFTGSKIVKATMPSNTIHDIKNDILKIVLKERYNDYKPAIGFVKGFGLKNGAIASSVAHDSHNIIAVGTDDESIIRAINKVVEMKGGLAWCGPDSTLALPLNIAGIISSAPVIETAAKYRQLTMAVRDAGSSLHAPFMTLSFMALLVIPELKIGDRGLFDVTRFCEVSLFPE
ncbi:MAG: adenine deaminase [Bacteroidales bacterium]|nr:adenine deaminase [Bacteroidales bacterium]